MCIVNWLRVQIIVFFRNYTILPDLTDLADLALLCFSLSFVFQFKLCFLIHILTCQFLLYIVLI